MKKTMILSIIGLIMLACSAAATTLYSETAEGGLSNTWHGVGNVTVTNTTSQKNNGSQSVNITILTANEPGGWSYLSQNVTNTSGDIVTMVFAIRPTANIRQDFGLAEASTCENNVLPHGPGIQWDTDSIGTLANQAVTWSTHFNSWETYVIKTYYNTTASDWYYNVSRNATLLAHSNPPSSGNHVQTLGCVRAGGGTGISYYLDDLSVTIQGGASGAAEDEARTAIEQGINNTLTGHTIITNQTMYTRNQSNFQATGKVDKFVTKGSKRWAFNYITTGESFLNLTTLGTAVNIWENTSLTTAQITQQVETLINATK